MAGGIATSGALGEYRNNTHPKWWKDPALLRLHGFILAIFLVPITAGYDNSLINNQQSQAPFLVSMGMPTPSTLGLIGAIGTVGAALGTWPGSYMTDRFGRLNGLTFGACLSITGALIQTFSYNVIQFIVGKAFVTGSVTVLTIAGASLVNEIAHPRYRGRIGGFYNVIWYVGALISTWLCYGMTLHVASDWQWRIPTLIQVLPALWTIGLRFWVPESPRWLINKGRHDEAAAFLYKYHANGDLEDEMVRQQLAEIHHAMDMEKQVKDIGTWKAAFTGRANRRRMLVMVLFGTSISWTSQGIVSYYNSAIYRQAGITGQLQQLGLNGGLYGFDLLCAFGGAMLSGYVGRKTMLLIGFGGMLAAHIVVTGLAATYARTGVPAVGYAIIAFFWVESGMYNVGLNPMTYLYPVEVNSYALRAKGIAMFLFGADLNGIVTRYVNPVGLANLGWRYYIIFCFLYVASIRGVVFLYPETRNGTLEEIEARVDGNLNKGGAVEMVDAKTADADADADEVGVGVVHLGGEGMAELDDTKK